MVEVARVQRLLCQLENNPQTGELRVHLSGPLSLFHHTTKYGHAMAAWLLCIDESLEAFKGKAKQPNWPVFFFKRRIDVDEFLVFLEGEIGRPLEHEAV